MMLTRMSIRTLGVIFLGLGLLSHARGWAEDAPPPSIADPAPPPASAAPPSAPMAIDPAQEAAPSVDSPEASVSVTSEPVEPDEPTPSESSSANEDRSLAIYDRELPSWSAQFTGSMHGMGSKSYVSGLQNDHIRGYSFQLDYQPTALQSAGVFGIGVSFNAYPERPHISLTTASIGLWGAGAHLRYQAKYFNSQWLVPFFGASTEAIRYHVINNGSGTVMAYGGFAGMMFLLNALDSDSAAGFYSNWGVKRSYLTAEFKGYAGHDTFLDLGGSSLFFGVRIEY